MRLNALGHVSRPEDDEAADAARERKMMIGASATALLLSVAVGLLFQQAAGICAGVGTLAAFCAFLAVAAAIPAHRTHDR